MKDKDITSVVKILKNEVRRFKTPSVTVIADTIKTPFSVLVSCVISLRTKDDVTATASKKLFKLARTPKATSGLTLKQIEEAIYPAGFYRNKAVTIKDMSKRLVSEYGGVVPDTVEELVTFKGVGRKTANLVVTLGYGKPGICVDIHVHRITNRWGYVATKNPDKTEIALREKLPRRYWIPINDLLVAYGQNLCKPVSPMCSNCKIDKYCSKVDVTTTR